MLMKLGIGCSAGPKAWPLGQSRAFGQKRDRGVTDGDLLALRVLPPRRLDLDAPQIRQAIREEVDLAREATCRGRLAVDREGDGGDHLWQFDHVSDLLLDDRPDAELGITASTEEEAVVSGVEGNGGHEVGVAEDGEAILA